MAIKDIFKFSRKTFFNPKGWMDWDRIAADNRYLWSILKNLFYPVPKGRDRSFEEVMRSQGLTDADIAKGITSYRTTALVFALLGLCMFFYMIYLFARSAAFSAILMSFGVCALLMVQAFKYDFWALQMRQRHLGLTFADWKRYYLSD
ncbi:MAG TPA: type IVB secretion system protein IcmV [Gammaproteobacteria bacterium]|jgi:hypothetical protein|nr:type IVB secretion system protein IcmV [Gammaproteobacteria bacterium]